MPMSPAVKPTPSDAFELTRAVLSADWAAAEPLLAAAPPQDALLSWLRGQHLAGQFAAALDDGPLAEMLPATSLRLLRGRLARQRAHNERVLAASQGAVAALDGAGIRCLLLKGVHWAERFCGGLERRFLWDLDLLVPADQREPALACLVRNGRHLRTGPLWNNRVTRGLTHAVALAGEADEIELDLHWRLRHRPAYRIDEAALWDGSRAFSLGESCFRVPSDEYCLLTLLLGIAHDLESGRLRLKLLFDLQAMLGALDATLDWDAFFAARERERLATLCINVLALYLLLFAPQARCPRLGAALAGRGDAVRVRDAQTALRLVAAPRQRLANRLWYAGVYPGGPLAYGLWWLGTAPLRFALGRTI